MNAPQPWTDVPLTARLVLDDGTVIAGQGLGATGSAVGEVCFNTAMTGYQEILTDPSYAGQIITFTFPHIGNVGANQEDTETSNLASRSGVRGCILRAPITEPSNYRAAENLDRWLKTRGIIAIAGVDTRALTARIREKGMPNGVIRTSASRSAATSALGRPGPALSRARRLDARYQPVRHRHLDDHLGDRGRVRGLPDAARCEDPRPEGPGLGPRADVPPGRRHDPAARRPLRRPLAPDPRQPDVPAYGFERIIEPPPLEVNTPPPAVRVPRRVT